MSLKIVTIAQIFTTRRVCESIWLSQCKIE